MSSGTMEFESIGWHIPHVPTTLFFAWIVWAVLIIMSIVVAKRAKLIPGVRRSFSRCSSNISAALPTSS